jgi:hypothetical protein
MDLVVINGKNNKRQDLVPVTVALVYGRHSTAFAGPWSIRESNPITDLIDQLPRQGMPQIQTSCNS